MYEYKLFLYDVWGNARDGYEVNNIHAAMRNIGGLVNPTIFDVEDVLINILVDDSDYKVNRKIGCQGITWESDYGTLYGTNKKNGKPFGELRQIKEEGN